MPGANENHYAVLGLPRDATSAEIRRAYHDTARRLHPDTNREHNTTEQFLQVQKAFDVLSNPGRRTTYDATLPAPDEYGVTVRHLFSRLTLSPSAEPQLFYTLLEVLAQPPSRSQPAPALNLCILIDRSTSMKGKRMEVVKSTARSLVDQLRPEDMLSIVTFADRAEVVLPPTRGLDKNKINAQLSLIQTGGGTELFNGLRLAYQQVLRNNRPAMVNHLILITDGHTYGDEENCIKLAKEASEAGIRISGLGIGSEWNDQLLDEIAGTTGGSSIYVSSSREIKQFLEKKFEGLNLTLAENARLVADELPENVEIQYVFRFQPDPVRLETGARIQLGNIQENQPLKVLMEFKINGVEPGLSVMRIFQGGLWVEVPSLRFPTFRKKLDWEFPVTGEATQPPPPAEIMQAMSRLSLYRMQERARQDMADGDFDSATRRLKNLATQLLAQGNRGLATMVLAEASMLENGSMSDEETQKIVKYSTRALMLPSNEDTETIRRRP